METVAQRYDVAPRLYLQFLSTRQYVQGQRQVVNSPNVCACFLTSFCVIIIVL